MKLTKHQLLELDNRGAASLAGAFGLDRLILECVPVDIARLASSLKSTHIRSIRLADLPIDGTLMPEGDGATILISRNRPPQRQRFTCAHELAHAILEPNVSAYRQLALTPDRPVEQLCDRIAAMLLMPNPLFSTAVARMGANIKGLEYLARLFYTSLQATATRMIQMVDKPYLLLVSDKNQSTEPMKIRWSVQNRLVEEEFPKWFIARGAPVRLLGATLAFDTAEVVNTTEVLKYGTFRPQALVESKAYGRGQSRFVLSFAQLM